MGKRYRKMAKKANGKIEEIRDGVGSAIGSSAYSRCISRDTWGS